MRFRGALRAVPVAFTPSEEAAQEVGGEAADGVKLQEAASCWARVYDSST